MRVSINEWGNPLSDEQVNNCIKCYKTDFYKYSKSIRYSVINELYTTIVNHTSLSNRAKLYYLDQFENLLISSRIHTDEDVISYKNSLPQ